MKRTGSSWRIAAVCLLLAAPASAKSFRAESSHAELQILDDGDVRITEHMRFRFIGGPFTRTFRTLSRRHSDGVEVESGSDSLEVRTGRVLQVVWHFPASADTVRDFTVTYRVHGALRSDGERRIIEWRVFPDQRRYAIQTTSARVSWPATWPAPLGLAAEPSKFPPIQGDHACVFQTGYLRRDRILRVRVEFPAAGIAVPVPQWQAMQAVMQQQMALASGLALALLGVGCMLVVVIYRELVPHRPAGVRGRRQISPPSDMPAALAGVLAAGDAHFQHMIACIVELAARGQLGFDGALSKRWWGGGEFMLRRGKPSTDRTPWEQALLDALARYEESGATSWSRALAALRGGLQSFKTATRTELQRRGDFDPRAGERPRALRSVALIAGLLALASFAVAAVKWTAWGPGTLLPGIALLVVMVIAMAAATTLPRYTPAGYQRAMAWRDFAAHLKVVAKQPAPLDVEQYHAWLPYALALGAAGEWIQAGKKWKLDVPAWFRVPGAEGMAGFAAMFAAASAAPSGASTTPGRAGSGTSGAH